MSKIKVIMQAGEIPLGSIVTKINGSKPYTLRDRIRLFPDIAGEPKELVASPGTVILVSASGDANTVQSFAEHVWQTDEATLLAFLQDREDEEAGS